MEFIIYFKLGIVLGVLIVIGKFIYWLFGEIQSKLEQAAYYKADSESQQLALSKIPAIAKLIEETCAIHACGKCYETKFTVIEISPSVSSIQLSCIHCNKKQRIRTACQNPELLMSLWKELQDISMNRNPVVINAKSTVDANNKKKSREKISSEIRHFVWNRDGKSCVECSSSENLHFDHMIPFSKGGANSAENLQLLCQQCNLKKSNKI